MGWDLGRWLARAVTPSQNMITAVERTGQLAKAAAPLAPIALGAVTGGAAGALGGMGGGYYGAYAAQEGAFGPEWQGGASGVLAAMGHPEMRHLAMPPIEQAYQPSFGGMPTPFYQSETKKVPAALIGGGIAAAGLGILLVWRLKNR